MPKFVTIGYGDEAGYNRTPQGLRDAAHAHDAVWVEAQKVAALWIQLCSLVQAHGKVAGSYLPDAAPARKGELMHRVKDKNEKKCRHGTMPLRQLERMDDSACAVGGEQNAI